MKVLPLSYSVHGLVNCCLCLTAVPRKKVPKNKVKNDEILGGFEWVCAGKRDKRRCWRWAKTGSCSSLVTVSLKSSASLFIWRHQVETGNSSKCQPSRSVFVAVKTVSLFYFFSAKRFVDHTWVSRIYFFVGERTSCCYMLYQHTQKCQKDKKVCFTFSIVYERITSDCTHFCCFASRKCCRIVSFIKW